MKKKLTALVLALLMTVAALPALAQTVAEELDAYWVKANPLYAQIEALGTRQAEIYKQFGLSLDDDPNQQPMDDTAYEQYVKGLNVLTDDELKKLMDTNAEIVKLADEMDELTAKHDASDDPTEQGVLHNLIEYKQSQIDQLTKSVADLDLKVEIAEETNYVMGLKGLTDDARQELLSMYATQRDVNKQLSALDDSLSEAAKAQLYGQDTGGLSISGDSGSQSASFGHGGDTTTGNTSTGDSTAGSAG
jgi:hypothetical protein